MGFGRLEALQADTRWAMSITCIETSFIPIEWNSCIHKLAVDCESLSLRESSQAKDLDVKRIAVSLHFINSKT